MFKLFFILLKKDIKENLLSSRAWFTITFFLICLLIFPLSFGKVVNLDLNITIPAIWISTLFANLIALDQMYKDDYSDGTLLYYYVNKISIATLVFAKCLSHWIFSGLPIVIIAPLCSYIFTGNISGSNYLVLTLLLGTPILTLIGSPVSALMLGSSTRGPILTFITLPFYLPIIIFGVMGSVDTNNNINAEFYLLSAILSIVVLLFPILTIKILKTVIN